MSKQSEDYSTNILWDVANLRLTNNTFAVRVDKSKHG